MSHTLTITLSDEQYETLQQTAKEQGQTPDALLASWIAWADQVRQQDETAHYHYYETEDWFRHLGATEDEITASRQRVRSALETPADADA